MSVLTNTADWPVEPPLAIVVFVGLLYWLGLQRRPPERRNAELRWRALSFYFGLLAIVAALDSPIAAYDNRLFSVHMTQHMLLMMVAPPLIVLGRPWLLVWQPLPLGFRRSVAKQLARAGWSAPLRRAGRFVARPVPAWLLANVTMVVWHLPALYDATVRSVWIHDLEHFLFFTTSLLLWLQLIDSPPFHARLDHGRRAAYGTAALAVGWLLAIVLALAPSPFYAAYADQASRPGGLSALVDQQLGAGVLWVPGSIALTLAVCINFYFWLDPEAGRRPRRLAGQH
jgi:cytochrome c oxidase assembly factor CtaG